MNVNAHGLELIKRFEGFRGAAYRCPAGVLTIGYGHTSAAGAPAVSRGMKMTKAVAARVLSSDVEEFAIGVEKCLRRDLTENQFSALVSFAYNVGLGAFAKSSVLRAVNKGDDESVPRRLALWVKASPRVLPGLQKRRAAEGHLYLMPEGAGLMSAEMPSFSASDYEAMDEARGLIEPLTGTPITQSTTAIGAVLGGIGGAFGYAQDALYQWRDVADYLPLPPRHVAWLTGLVLVGAATLWIIRERYIKSRDDAI